MSRKLFAFAFAFAFVRYWHAGLLVDWSYFGRSSTPTGHFLSPGNTLPVGQGRHQCTLCLLRTKGQNGTFPYKSQHMLGCHCAGRTFRGYHSASKALGQQRSDATKQPLSGWWDQMVYSFNYIQWMSTIHTYLAVVTPQGSV